MNDKLKSFLKISLSLGFGIFLIYLFYKKLSPSDILDMKTAVKNANYWFLLLSVSFTFISQSFRALRWKSLIGAAGHQITWLKSFNAISINYFVNLGIPRAGELARCGVIATYDEVPVNKSIATLVNERLVDLILLLLVGFLAFILQYQVFMDFYNKYLAMQFLSFKSWLLQHPFVLGSVMVLGLIGLVFVVLFLRKESSNSEGKFKNLINGFKEGILSIFRLEKPGMFIIQSLLIWVCYLFMIFFAFKTIDLGTTLGFGAALSLLFFGTFGFLATPGGIGAYPLIAGYLLVLYGVEMHLGSTMGWVLWIGQTTLIIILGLTAFTILSREKNLKLKILSDGDKD